ncbi:hypothetical protein KR026_007603 [Drosophila bipectinata]|nr:hypothetical protein KR026_007603 [Drosophila bipectinata]
MWVAPVVVVPFLGFVMAFKDCGLDRQCVPYEQCKEGLVLDGILYPDRSRTQLDEECHYMEKCCNQNDTLDTPEVPVNLSFWSCGGRQDLWYYLRPLGYKQQEARFGEFPWTVAVFGAGGYLCSGALITPLAMITTASCVQNETLPNLRLVAGEWDAAVELEPLPRQERTVVEVLLHSNYTTTPIVNNIALLLVDKDSPFQLSPNIQLICLPPPQMVYDFSQCYVSGWQRRDFGGSAILPKRWTLYALPSDQCRAKLRLSYLGRRHALNDSLLCAGGDKGDFICQDVDMSGVPLMCPLPGDGDRFVLAGLLARPTKCDGPQLLAIFTNVQFYRQWIDLRLRERDLDIRPYMV